MELCPETVRTLRLIKYFYNRLRKRRLHAPSMSEAYLRSQDSMQRLKVNLLWGAINEIITFLKANRQLYVLLKKNSDSKSQYCFFAGIPAYLPELTI